MNLITEYLRMGQCLTGGDPGDFELWIGRYAEMLGCQPRAGAVSVAIEEATGTGINQQRILWLESMAEMLCCEPTPMKVKESVEKLHQQMQSAKRMIAKLRKENANRS